MNKLTTIASTSALSLVIASSVTANVLAWHPQGQITKSVQNLTTGTEAAKSVSAKPGDILQYTVEVSDIAPAADKHYNDMANTVMTDTLPAGVTMVDGSSSTIKADIGTILPGKSVTKQYKVKVTASKDGQMIENKACYTATSSNNDTKLNGCDTATVKVNVPVVVTPPAPVTPVVETPVVETPGKGADETPAPVTDVTVPEELPNTGVSKIVPIAGFASMLIGFVVSTALQKRRVQN